MGSNATDLDRTLPHNLEAERSVLGAILLHNDAYNEVAPLLQATDFFRDAHRRIYQAMVKLLDTPGGSVDTVMLKDELGRKGEIDEVGGPAYVSSLIDGVPRSMNAKHYARTVREKSLLRQMVFAGNKLVSKAYAGEDDAHEILTQHDYTIMGLQRSRQGRLRCTSETMGDLIEELEFYARNPGQLRGWSTGFDAFDALTMGIQPGMHVVAARPSMGKTTLVLNLVTSCCNALRPDGTRRRAYICSFEQKRKALELRLLSSLSAVHHTTLKSGLVSEGSWRNISTGLQSLKEMGIFIDDDSQMTVADIRAHARQMQADGGLDLIVIDYIQLMKDPLARRGSNRTEELTGISRQLKLLSDELDVAIIVVSQLKRTQGEPQLDDLRETGALEQDADTVTFLHRKHHSEYGVTKIVLAKQREGPVGSFPLFFNEHIARFLTPTDEQMIEARNQAADAKASDHQAAKVRAIIRARRQKEQLEKA